MRIRNTERGFSLIETILVIALFSIIMIAVVEIYLRYDRLFQVQQSTISATDSARTFMDEAHASVSQASQIVASYTFSGTLYTTGSTTLVVQLPSITSTGDSISNTYDYSVFYATGTNAYEITSIGSGSARSAGTKHLGSSFGTISFTYNSSDVTTATDVDVDVTTRTSLDGQTTLATESERMYLRNI